MGGADADSVLIRHAKGRPSLSHTAQVPPHQDPPGSSRNRRPRRRQVLCPIHPEEPLISVSPKHMLYITDSGPLVLAGIGKHRANEILEAYNHALSIGNEWLECFWCDRCQASKWWHVTRRDRIIHELTPINRELWERASGVIRPEGNPTVGEFTRKNARANGVIGAKQYRFL